MEKFVAVQSVEFWQGISSRTPALSNTIWAHIEKRQKRLAKLSDYQRHYEKARRLRVVFVGEEAGIAREAVESAK